MKLLVEFIQPDDRVTVKEYASLKALNEDYPHIPYHQLRAVYLYSTGQCQKKFLHPRTQALVHLLKIRPIQMQHLLSMELAVGS